MTERQIDRAILDLLANGRERKVAFVVAVLARARDSDDSVRVEAAIRDLIAAGKVEARGDISEWRHSEIRLIS